MPRLTISILISCAGAAFLSVLASCNYIIPTAYIVGGLPKKDAVYELPDRRTVVFVDDRNNVLSRSALRRAIGTYTSDELMQNEVVTVTIQPRDAITVARRESPTNPMAMDEIGRAVGADQLIYVEMLSFSLTPDGFTPRPTAACTIKVIDVQNEVRLFPDPQTDMTAYFIQTTTGEVSPELFKTSSSRRRVEDMLSAQLGDTIAKLFYQHRPDEIGSRLDGPG